MRFAIFDLDHTLLPFDTQTLFCNFVLRRERWRVLMHGVFLPFALLRAVKLAPTVLAKRAFLSYLVGMPQPRLEKLAWEFAEGEVTRWIYPELRAEIARHKTEGRTLILNTASPAFYARAIAKVLGFDHCVSTSIIVDDPMPLIPRIGGPNNKRAAKIAAMNAAVPATASMSETDRADSWGYSDSSADIPLLEFCGRKVLIHPSAELSSRFPDAQVLKPGRPYSGKLGNLLLALRQVAGLF